jgi:hypothetical protein
MQSITTTLSYSTYRLRQESRYLGKLEVEVVLPEKIKEFLCDDWEAVTREQRVGFLKLTNIN